MVAKLGMNCVLKFAIPSKLQTSFEVVGVVLLAWGGTIGKGCYLLWVRANSIFSKH